jgi:Family of unknown function (DUF6573)
MGATNTAPMQEEFEMSMEEEFGEVISTYSRCQAIEDGVLVSLNDPSFTFRPGLNICAEAGIKFPVAMTIAAFAKTVSEVGTPLPPCQDISGRLWDVLSVFKLAARRGGSEIRFPVSVINWVYVGGKRVYRTKREMVILKALCGPGDNGEPFITIMLAGED